MNGDVMKKVIAPKGFLFKILDKTYDYNYHQIQLWKKNGKMIGRISLEKEYPGCYTTHSSLDSQYHNRGLGALMYAKAIQWGWEHGYRIKSSGSSSDMAQRVWRGKSIRKWFDIRVKLGHGWPDQTLDPRFDTFYPRPKKEDRKQINYGKSKRVRKGSPSRLRSRKGTR